jgi:hypothetical protein
LVHGAAESGDERVGRRADCDVAIAGAIYPERCQARQRQAGPHGDATLGERFERLVCQQRRGDAEHGNIDVLSESRASRLVKGGKNPDDAKQRRAQIAHRKSDADRRIA